jgi:hypothetical protein
MGKTLLASLAFAAALSLFGEAASAAADAGKVLTFNNDCFVVAGDQRTALKIGDSVHVGDAIEVPNGAKLKLRMNDGSVLALASGTHLTIAAYGTDSAGQRDVKLGLGSGLLRAIVAKVSQPSVFEVDTATSVAAVRATDWFIETGADQTTVDVLAGSVSFSALDAKGNAAAGGVTIPARSGSELTIPAAPATPPQTGKRPPSQQPRPEPSPPMPVTQAAFDALIDRTSVAFGWCQCIADTTRIRASCESSVDNCKTACGGGKYAFIPKARLSCAGSYADVPVPGQAQP